ncbi:16761_t:CDS:2, partial [Acaulospora colombiana]
GRVMEGLWRIYTLLESWIHHNHVFGSLIQCLQTVANRLLVWDHTKARWSHVTIQRVTCIEKASECGRGEGKARRIELHKEQETCIEKAGEAGRITGLGVTFSSQRYLSTPSQDPP